MTLTDPGSVHPAQPDMYGSDTEEPAPAPVFVDQSGVRGRMLRGLGWPVSLVGAVLAAAMAGSLIGGQSEAPAMSIPPQPSLSPSPSPSPTPSPSPSPTPPASSSPATRPATTRGKTPAATSKPVANTPRKATSSGQPTKHA
ncbi:hypothetical protein ABT095_21190 [Kitasatospora sp. NPDC002227]|uniref:hypothetical protein n=1 Tax=Kitasatospora sp. NPDC002227 TaxID=3154773 RepID=UPI003327CBEC